MDSAERDTVKICSINDCTGKATRRGWCSSHYYRWKRHGDPQAGRIYGDDVKRFWSKVNKTEACWIYLKEVDHYGSFTTTRAVLDAHRYAYELCVGPIPADMQVDHTCFTKRCVNPEHLRLATTKQNGENRAGAPRNNNTSGIRGVSWSKARNGWYAYITHHGRMQNLGCYSSRNEAAAVAQAKRNELFTHNNLDKAG